MLYFSNKYLGYLDFDVNKIRNKINVQFGDLSGRTLKSEDYEVIKHGNIIIQKRKRKIY